MAKRATRWLFFFPNQRVRTKCGLCERLSQPRERRWFALEESLLLDQEPDKITESGFDACPLVETEVFLL